MVVKFPSCNNHPCDRMRLFVLLFCLVLQAHAVPVVRTGADFLSATINVEIVATETSFGALAGSVLGLTNAGFEQVLQIRFLPRF